jgi:hypothetical protein
VRTWAVRVSWRQVPPSRGTCSDADASVSVPFTGEAWPRNLGSRVRAGVGLVLAAALLDDGRAWATAASSSPPASGPARNAHTSTPTSATVTEPARAYSQTGRPSAASSSSSPIAW